MNDHPPLEPVGDASLEARIVAWVLGEASAFEAGELERLCDERPELLVFRRRMRALHGILSEAESAEPDDAWKLPPEKRAKIEELFGESQPEQDIPILQPAAPSGSLLKPGRFHRRRRSKGPAAPSRWLVKTILTAAACAMFGMLYRFGFEERSSMKVAAKSVDFLPSEARTKLVGGVGITGGSSFEVAPQSQAAQSRAWHGRSDDNGRIAGEKKSQSSVDADRQPASGADYSYKAKAAQAVADTDADGFTNLAEFQPPELPNSVVPPNASLPADATKGVAKSDFEGFVNQGSPINQAGQADEIAPSETKGKKLAARPPASEAKPGEPTGNLAFASGSESSFSRFAATEGEFATRQLEAGDNALRRRRQEVWGESQVKDRVSRGEIPVTPATPTGGFKNDLTEADSFAESPSGGRDRITADRQAAEPKGQAAAKESPSDLALGTSNGQAMDFGQAIQRTRPTQNLNGGTALGFGFGGGSGGGAGDKTMNAAIDEVSSLGLETKKEGALASDAGQIAGSLTVSGKSDLGDIEGAKSQIADGTLNGNGTIVTGGQRRGDGVITRGNIDAILNNPNRAGNLQDTPAREDVAKLDMPAAIPAPAAIAPPAPPVTAAPAKPASASAKASGDFLDRAEFESRRSELGDSAPDQKADASKSMTMPQQKTQSLESLKSADKSWEMTDGGAKKPATTAMFENPLRQKNAVENAIEVAADFQSYDDAKREFESANETLAKLKKMDLGEIAQSGNQASPETLNELRKSVRDQEDKVEELRKLQTTIVRTKGIIPTGEGSLFRNGTGEDDRGAGTAREMEYKIEQDKIQLESQIKSLLNYSSDQLLTYASGLDLPENSIKELYPNYLEQKRALDDMKSKGLAEEHPAVKAQKEQINDTRKQLEEGVTNLRETLKAQQDMAIERLAKVKTLSSEKKGEAIDTAVDAQDYIDARRELDSDQEMLRTMKVKLLGETIQERIPSSSIVVHEEPVIEKPGWLSLDRRYQSSTAVQVKPRNPGITVLGRETSGSSGQPQMSPQFFANEFEIVKSRNVLMKVAEQLNLSNKWEIPKEKVVEELQKSITVTNRPGTDLIDIKVKNDDAGTAREVAAEVAKAYKNYRTEIETRDSERALQELRKAVREQEEKVEERRKLVTTIARTKGIVPSDSAPEMSKVEQDKIQLESQIKSLLNYSNDQLLVYASGLDLPENKIKNLYPKYLEQKLRFDRLKTQGLDEKNPTIQAESQNLANTRKQLEEGLTTLRESLMEQLDKANERLTSFQTQAPASAKSIPKSAPAPVPIPTDEISASGEAFSTFSLHVSDASFKVAKAAMDRGERPDPESVRPEEFYNAFDYGDPTPAPGEPVACAIEQAAHPILPQRNLVRVAMRTGAAGRAASQPLNLTVLLDHSGSMEREDRHEGLNQAIVQLASLLKAGDTITVAGFSRTPRLMADRLPGERAKELIDIVRNTPSEGGTNLEEALKLGGDLALRQKNPAAQNRIVLLTDGAANLGNAKPEDLAERIRALRQQGISFDAAGLGAGGVNDRMLETLTRDGNGRYYLIDQPSDADANFAKQLAGAFRPAAENVKVQVHFNPARVGRYKLIGFEKHRLKTEDFRNDKVDAAELAAEEAGVALYQVETLPQGTGEIGEASVRFKDTSTGQMVEQTWTIAYDEKAPAFDQATPSMQLATLAALSAEKLRGGPLAEAIDFQSLTPQVAKIRAHYATSKTVGDLIEMIGKLK